MLNYVSIYVLRLFLDGLLSDNKMTSEQQDGVIEVVRACFE